jgi:hypothetical protein
MASTTLQDALLPPEGPEEVTRIEIDVLDNGSCRWTLWNGPRRLYVAVANPEAIVAMLQTTKIIVCVMAAKRIAPDEKEEGD